jgi:hypothetical protein
MKFEFRKFSSNKCFSISSGVDMKWKRDDNHYNQSWITSMGGTKQNHGEWKERGTEGKGREEYMVT